jgi:hypothetical protein
MNPTLLVVMVALVWVAIGRAFSFPWPVTLLIAAIVVNALLWAHGRWARHRAAHALEPGHPYSREDE